MSSVILILIGALLLFLALTDQLSGFYDKLTAQAA